MRILNRNQKEVEGTCLKCGADLAICRADIKWGWFNAYVICPVCGIKLTISNRELYRFGYQIDDED